MLPSRLRATCLTASLIAIACAGDEQQRSAADQPLEVVDDAGRTVRLERPPGRVVSLVPWITDLVLALGAGDRLIARTDYDADPRLDALPSVGGGLTPSLEWLVAAAPELVIAWPDGDARSIMARLTALGIPSYAASVQTLDQTRSTVRRIGRLLGREAAADSLLAANRVRVDSVRRTLAATADSPAVLYLIALDPPMTVGPGTFLHELIGIAGGRNVFHDAESLWPLVGLEEIVRRDPDVIVLADAATPAGRLRALRTAPGWRELRAVRSGRIVAVDVDLLNRPGPETGAAARHLADALHARSFTAAQSP